MPNWCENTITLSHKDPAMIDRVVKGQEGLLMEFLPTPKELVDTVAGFMGEDKREFHEAQMKRNDTAQPGDVLYLTKPLGIGVYTTAEKKGLLRADDVGVRDVDVEAPATIRDADVVRRRFGRRDLDLDRARQLCEKLSAEAASMIKQLTEDMTVPHVGVATN